MIIVSPLYNTVFNESELKTISLDLEIERLDLFIEQKDIEIEELKKLLQALQNK